MGPTSLLDFAINLSLAAFFSLLLAAIYTKHGKSLSNRKLFANQFVLIAMTTMLIISIVKTSLALSLGLVGALSIVRFRSAIKEPEELSFLFLSIGIGLGFGAGQKLITILGFVLITSVVVLRSWKQSESINKKILLTLQDSGENRIDIENVVSVLNKYCQTIDLRRLDESGDKLEASFFIQTDDFSKLTEGKSALQLISPKLKLSYADYGGLL